MSYEAYKTFRLAPDHNGCWDVLTPQYEQVATYPSKIAAKRAIDEIVTTKASDLSSEHNASRELAQTTNYKEAKEKLAAIEHERWADWQKWVHHKCTEIEDDEGDPLGLMIPAGYVEHLERQIKTPYAKLSDKEKASDMEQVDRYWPIVEQLISQACTEARIDELSKYQDWLNSEGRIWSERKLFYENRITELADLEDALARVAGVQRPAHSSALQHPEKDKDNE